MTVPAEIRPMQWYVDRCEERAVLRVSPRLALLHTIEAAYREAEAHMRLEQTLEHMPHGPRQHSC